MTALSGIDVILLAGGYGKRLRSVVPDVPKILAPVAGKPFLQWQLERLAALGAHKAVLALAHESWQVTDWLQNNAAPMWTEFVWEKSPRGTATAISLASWRTSSQPVLALNGDTWFMGDFAPMIHRPPEFTPSAVVARTKGGVNCGAFAISRRVIQEMRSSFKTSLEDEVLPILGEALETVIWRDGDFLDMGTPVGYARINELLAKESA